MLQGPMETNKWTRALRTIEQELAERAGAYARAR